MLPAGDYELLLEADEYEPLNRTISVSLDSRQFTFYLVKTADRAQLNTHLEMFRIYMDSLILALRDRDPFLARQLITDIQNYQDYKFTVSDTIINYYNAMTRFWSESLLILAKTREDSLQLADAHYYYRRIVDFDSTITGALEGLKRVELKLLEPLKPAGGNQSAVKTKSPEEIERLFQDGVSKFLAEEYDEALRIFKTVLSYDPDHENAKNYLARTNARINILGK
jgi:tetratricopeptide (TPR) repeat protein